jgi:hypothetical protein
MKGHEPYSIFLMIQLMNCHSEVFSELPYDEMYGEGCRIYDIFYNSAYNNSNRSEYDCMVSFIKSYLSKLAFDEASRNVIVKDIEVDVESMTYAVKGEGFPTQVIPYDEIDEWNSIKDEEGNPIVDIQIGYDDDKNCYSFQYVNLVRVLFCENGVPDYNQGDKWECVLNEDISVVNSDTSHINSEDYILWDIKRNFPFENLDDVYHYTTVVDLINEGFKLGEGVIFRRIIGLSLGWQVEISMAIRKSKS